MWIRHLTQNLGVNLAGVRILFELEERLGTRILESLYDEGMEAGAASGGGTEDEQRLDPDPRTANAAASGGGNAGESPRQRSARANGVDKSGT
jgi:hypothetical protein